MAGERENIFFRIFRLIRARCIPSLRFSKGNMMSSIISVSYESAAIRYLSLSLAKIPNMKKSMDFSVGSQ
jgi:hypothetical protein